MFVAVFWIMRILSELRITFHLLYFPKLQEEENLRALEQTQETARLAAVQKQLDKLTTVEDL